MIPTIRFTPEEYANESIHQDTLLIASELYRTYGFLVLMNVFSSDFINILHTSFIKHYRHYFYDTDFSDALSLGDKRHMLTVELRPPFSTPSLYANPFVFPIIKRLLGQDCILGGFGSTVSLPDAADQSVHRDLPRLFNHEIDRLIPSFAITMMIPIVELNKVNGTTRVWANSHIASDEELESLHSEDLQVPIGACYLMDYRLLHQGTANRSKQVRPIMYNLYSRYWFGDRYVYRKQPEIQISREEYQKIPEDHKGLFSIATISDL